jgi:hypothetical protein
VAAQLPAPVGGLGDLAAQALDRDPELGAVGLDGAPDLLRGAGGAPVRASVRSTAVGVAGCGAVSVALMSCASSMAIFGVGGEPLRKKRAARKPARPPSRNSAPATMR